MKILIVEDHIALLEGVVNYIKGNINNVDVYSTTDGEKALRMIVNQKFDIIITDLNLPGLNGIDLIKEIKSKKLNLKIIVLTMYYNSNIVNNLKKLNINAFLTKNVSLSEIKEAFNAINNNETYITPEIQNLYNNSFISVEDEIILNDGFSKTYNLSKREIEVLDLMIENFSNDDIAKKLFLGKETVKTHRKNLFRKLGVNNLLDLYKLLVSCKYVKI
jgi:DNA-binding NarL/FixJ family response regulator